MFKKLVRPQVLVAIALIGATIAIASFGKEVYHASNASHADTDRYLKVTAAYADAQAWPDCDQMAQQQAEFLDATTTEIGVLLAKTLSTHAITMGCGSAAYDPKQVEQWVAAHTARSASHSLAFRFFATAYRLDEKVVVQLARTLHPGESCMHERAQWARDNGSISPNDAVHRAAVESCSAADA